LTKAPIPVGGRLASRPTRFSPSPRRTGTGNWRPFPPTGGGPFSISCDRAGRRVRTVGRNIERVCRFAFYGSEAEILVVEDDALLRLYAAGLLEENGFGVVETENADAALKLLETRDDVRLLFTDIQMPGSCDGMDLARQVHARWPRILLVITSRHMKPAEAEIPDHGHFIGKPYGANELLDEVNDMIRKPG
jgi:two-component system, response regulator PdtaR